MAKLWKGLLRDHVPDYNQLVGLLTLVIFAGIFMLLAGATLIAILLAFAFLGPILLLTSPIWVPAAIFLFAAVTMTLSVCGFAAAGVAGAIWMYRYVNGRYPEGSDSVDLAISMQDRRATSRATPTTSRTQCLGLDSGEPSSLFSPFLLPRHVVSHCFSLDVFNL